MSLVIYDSANKVLRKKSYDVLDSGYNEGNYGNIHSSPYIVGMVNRLNAIGSVTVSASTKSVVQVIAVESAPVSLGQSTLKFMFSAIEPLKTKLLGHHRIGIGTRIVDAGEHTITVLWYDPNITGKEFQLFTIIGRVFEADDVVRSNSNLKLGGLDIGVKSVKYSGGRLIYTKRSVSPSNYYNVIENELKDYSSGIDYNCGQLTKSVSLTEPKVCTVVCAGAFCAQYTSNDISLTVNGNSVSPSVSVRNQDQQIVKVYDVELESGSNTLVATPQNQFYCSGLAILLYCL